MVRARAACAQETCPLMRHFATLAVLLTVATTLAGCGDDDPVDLPSQPSPVATVETFNATLTVNGAQTHSFPVDRPGTVTAQVKTLSDQAATLGISLGTWNGAACQIIISNTAAVLNTTVVGTATTAGQFCVWLNDVGKLTAGVDYSVDVTHF
jgi:predicted small lipoprotein YifL